MPASRDIRFASDIVFDSDIRLRRVIYAVANLGVGARVALRASDMCLRHVIFASRSDIAFGSGIRLRRVIYAGANLGEGVRVALRASDMCLRHVIFVSRVILSSTVIFAFGELFMR